MQRNQTGREDVIIGAGLYCFGVIDVLSYLIGSELSWGTRFSMVIIHLYKCIHSGVNSISTVIKPIGQFLY